MQIEQQQIPAIAAIAGLILAAPAAHAHLEAELAACASLPSAIERVDCYDALAATSAPVAAEPAEAPEIEQASAAPVAEPVETAAVPVAAAAASVPQDSLPDDVGGFGYEEADTKSDDLQAALSSCRKGADSRWYFYFENGQVWKQVDTKNVRFRDCEQRTATLAKDAIGYKVQVDGNDRSVRVSRRR